MKKSFLRILVLSVCIFGFILLLSQCKKDKAEQIPYVYVNFYINPNSTQYQELNNIGGYLYVTGGVRGIILYRRSIDEFVALERDCPYHPSDACANCQVDHSGMIVVDSCCGSQFLLMDGSIVKGPATIQMKLYETSYDGSNLHVFN